MKLRLTIVLLTVILVALLLLIPFVERLDEFIPSTIGETLTDGIIYPSDTTESEHTASGLESQPNTQPSMQATTVPIESVPISVPPSNTPTTVPPITSASTAPPTATLSPNFRVIAFEQERKQTWICPLQDAFGAVTGSRTFASSRGGGKRAHAGLDFVAPHGTKVYAITSGTVQRVAVFYQNTWAVEVTNDDGSILRYCEIATKLSVGDKLSQGDLIGTILRAESGTEMLHMEVYYGDGKGMLTQSDNKNYSYVDSTKNYMRRSDLMDPTFLKDLKTS